MSLRSGTTSVWARRPSRPPPAFDVYKVYRLCQKKKRRDSTSSKVQRLLGRDVKRVDVMNKYKSMFSFIQIDFSLGLALSLCGCLWQYFYVSKDYFKYETISQVSILEDMSLRSPALTVCFDYKRLAKPGIKVDDSLMSSQQIIDATHEATDIVQFFKYRDPEVAFTLISSWDIDKVFKVKTFLKSDHKCFTFIRKVSKETIFESDEMQFSKDKEVFFSFVFSRKALVNTSRFYLYLHDPEIIPRGNSEPNVEVNYGYRKMSHNGSQEIGFDFTYKTIKTFLMPPPYRSQCKNYTREGLESKEHCLQNCLLKQNFDFFSRIPMTSTVTEDSLPQYKEAKLIGYSEFWKLKGHSAKQRQVKAFLAYCRKACWRRDCSRVFYVPSLNGKPWISENLSLEIFTPTEPQVVSETHVKFSLTEYIVQMLSITGFWFGFSGVGFLPQMTQLVHISMKVKRRFSV